jgi:hypothetical protein
MTKIKAEDDHDVDSELERNVDNALFMSNLTHDVHPSIPGSNFKADFKVGDVFVEVWGREEDEKYKKQMEEKLNYYTVKGLRKRLVELNAEDCMNVRSLRKKVDEIKNKMSQKQAVISSIKEQKHIQHELDSSILAALLAKEELEPIDTEVQTLKNSKNETEHICKIKIKEIESKIKKLADEKMAIIKKYM